jgi:hypothetical protein
MARTKLLCVQVQPTRAESIELEASAALLASRVMLAGVRELFIERGRAYRLLHHFDPSQPLDGLPPSTRKAR